MSTSKVKHAVIDGNGMLRVPPGRRWLAGTGASGWMLDFGQQLRDELIWKYPIIGGTIITYQTLASNREYRIIGSSQSRALAALDYINNARTVLKDGTIDYGFEQFEKRRSIDHVVVGRTTFTYSDMFLDYLDPCDIEFLIADGVFRDRYTGSIIKPDVLVRNHTIPIGNSGSFVSPLLSVMPTAMLMWLVREHDSSALDGRKIREMKIVLGRELAELMVNAIEDLVKLHSGSFEPGKLSIPVVYTEDIDVNSASDLVASLGISNIPENFDRRGLKIEFVNELGNATGLTIRQFWNDEEKGTNRALEEVQEQRQTVKGPAAFTRTEQTLINASGCLRQFGRRTRLMFKEEVDAASRKIDAEVILAFSAAFEKFVDSLGGSIDIKNLIHWFQSINMLPADIDIIKDVKAVTSDSATPQENERIVEDNTDDGEIREIENNSRNSDDEIAKSMDYGEVIVDQNGNKLFERVKSYSFQSKVTAANGLSFRNSLIQARRKRFKTIKSLNGDIPEHLKNIPDIFDDVTDDQHQEIFNYLKSLNIVPK